MKKKKKKESQGYFMNPNLFKTYAYETSAQRHTHTMVDHIISSESSKYELHVHGVPCRIEHLYNV